MQNTPKILFLGDSRLNAAIDFTKIDSAYSFATGGVGSIECYFILKKYLQKNPKPKFVFLSISPRFFTQTLAFYTYAVRNDFFSYSEFAEIIESKKQFTSDTILGDYEFLKYFFYTTKYPGYYQADVYRAYGFTAYKQNKVLLAEFLRMNGARFHPGLRDSCGDLNFETKMKNFEPSDLLNYYFDQIFDLCRKDGITLIFMSMPMNESSFSRLNADFITNYQKYIERYSIKYPEFSVSDMLFYLPNRYFGDESHLNESGKQYFTKLIQKKNSFSSIVN